MFYIKILNNYTIKFHVFIIKTDMRNMTYRMEFEWKLTKNRFKIPRFLFFSQRTIVINEKRKNLFDFLSWNRIILKFNTLTIKNDFVNMLENVEFRFKNNLIIKVGYFNCYHLQLSQRFQSISLILNRILWRYIGAFLSLKQFFMKSYCWNSICVI